MNKSNINISDRDFPRETNQRSKNTMTKPRKYKDKVRCLND